MAAGQIHTSLTIPDKVWWDFFFHHIRSCGRRFTDNSFLQMYWNRQSQGTNTAATLRGGERKFQWGVYGEIANNHKGQECVVLDFSQEHIWQNVTGKNSNGPTTSAQENNTLFMSLLVTGQKNVLAKIPGATTGTGQETWNKFDLKPRHIIRMSMKQLSSVYQYLSAQSV